MAATKVPFVIFPSCGQVKSLTSDYAPVGFVTANFIIMSLHFGELGLFEGQAHDLGVLELCHPLAVVPFSPAAPVPVLDEAVEPVLAERELLARPLEAGHEVALPLVNVMAAHEPSVGAHPIPIHLKGHVLINRPVEVFHGLEPGALSAKVVNDDVAALVV